MLLYRRVLAADLYESFRASSVPLPVTLDDDKVWTFPQCHRNRFGRLDADLLGRDGCRRDDAAAVAGVSGDDRRDKTDILMPALHQLHCRPAQKGRVDVNMEYHSSVSCHGVCLE